MIRCQGSNVMTLKNHSRKKHNQTCDKVRFHMQTSNFDKIYPESVSTNNNGLITIKILEKMTYLFLKCHQILLCLVPIAPRPGSKRAQSIAAGSVSGLSTVSGTGTHKMFF
uniref:Uncharacterized protein n=1 Tax=Photinus pyralis TaxID=7054 RepID=A0A1Y1KL41_PHOPY